MTEFLQATVIPVVFSEAKALFSFCVILCVLWAKTLVFSFSGP